MCKEQVHQFPGARFKKFTTRSAAEQYISDCKRIVSRTQNGEYVGCGLYFGLHSG